MISLSELAERLADDPGRSGLFLDFDGTLTPIVDDPATARLPEGVAAALAELARRLGLVAVVSGRPAAYLAGQLADTPVRLLGLYGLEEWRAGAAVPRPDAAAWQPAVRRARELLGEQLADCAGVLVEDKGLAVAAHWRNAPDRSAAQDAVERAVTVARVETGLGRQEGKLVVELRPPVPWDKGSGVRALADESGLVLVIVVGDDLGDLAAFEAAAERGGVSVAVAHGEETPDELRAAADLVVEGQAGVAALLDALAAALAP